MSLLSEFLNDAWDAAEQLAERNPAAAVVNLAYFALFSLPQESAHGWIVRNAADAAGLMVFAVFLFAYPLGKLALKLNPKLNGLQLPRNIATLLALPFAWSALTYYILAIAIAAFNIYATAKLAIVWLGITPLVAAVLPRGFLSPQDPRTLAMIITPIAIAAIITARKAARKYRERL